MKRLPSVAFPLPSGLYYGWVIVGVAVLMNLVASPTNPVIFSFFIGPMSEELGWSRSTLSWALTFRLAAAGVSSPFLGALVDRYGARWLGVAAGFIAGGCLIAFAFTHHVWYLYLISAVSGLGGFGGPGGALLTMVPTARWFRAKRGRALAIATIGMPGGTVLGIPLAQWLITTIGWREAWVVFGIVVMAVVVPLSFLFMRRAPEDLGLAVDGVPGGEAPAAQGQRRRQATTVDWTAGQAMRTPAFWFILGGLGVSGLALNGTLVHRVSFWAEVGMSPALVALGTALDPLTVIFSALLFGAFAERVRTRYLGLVAGGGWALSMLPMIFPTAHAGSILSHGIAWGLFAGSHITVNNLIWPNYYGSRHLG
ncbi:MAG: MFS transporter, partial [SAR202 cluster bacterium]|nr:MFS transporter [SAR202 cluster bacterium]